MNDIDNHFQTIIGQIKYLNFENFISVNKNDENIQLTINYINLDIIRLIKNIRYTIQTKIIFLFDCEMYLVNQNIDFEVDFSNCTFLKKISFQDTRFIENVKFIESCFLNEVSFNGATFEKKVRFHNSIFKKSILFENTIFKGLVDFYNATFEDVQQFYLTEFLNVTIFSKVKFHKQTQFLYNKVSSQSIISFQNTEFHEGLDISRANFICKLQFFGVNVTKTNENLFLYINDDINCISPNKNKKIAFQKLRESYRIIKNEFAKEGNNIESLKFYRYEMEAYEKEIDNLSDFIIVKFNKFSNNFGVNWIKSIIFTLFIALIFYIPFLISFSELEFDLTLNSVLITLKHYVEFLNLTKWELKPFGIEKYNIGYVILFIGRLFISYGYYQTIQAFRKFGKS